MNVVSNINEFLSAAQAGIQCWAWNGYNSQYGESASKEVLEARVKEFTEQRNHKVTYLETGEHTTVMLHNEYDFYGSRESVHYVTTRAGSYKEDPEDNLAGVFVLTTNE